MYTIFTSFLLSGDVRQARIALRFPWWTLSGGFQEAAHLAELPSSAAAVRKALDMQVYSPALPPVLKSLSQVHETQFV